MRSFKYGTNMENQATLSLVIFDKSPKTAIFYKKSTLIFKNAEGKVVEGTLNEETHCKRPPFLGQLPCRFQALLPRRFNVTCVSQRH